MAVLQQKVAAPRHDIEGEASAALMSYRPVAYSAWLNVKKRHGVLCRREGWLTAAGKSIAGVAYCWRNRHRISGEMSSLSGIYRATEAEHASAVIAATNKPSRLSYYIAAANACNLLPATGKKPVTESTIEAK